MISANATSLVEAEAQIKHPPDAATLGGLFKVPDSPQEILLHPDALVKAQAKAASSICVSKFRGFPKPGNGLFWVHVHKNLKRVTMDSRLFA